MMGIAEDAAGRPGSAWTKLVESACRGYMPAQILVVDSLTNDINPYGVPKDEGEAVRILQSVPERKQTPEMKRLLAKIFVRLGRKDEAREVLLEAAPTSPDARMDLVKLLETMRDRNGSFSRECVGHLEVLQDEGNPEAMALLADHLYHGKGIKKDRQRAKGLAKRAHELDESLPEVYEMNGMAMGGAIVTGVSIVLLGGVILFRSFRRRR
jgi:TPR repeat protein